MAAKESNCSESRVSQKAQCHIRNYLHCFPCVLAVETRCSATSAVWLRQNGTGWAARRYPTAKHPLYLRQWTNAHLHCRVRDSGDRQAAYFEHDFGEVCPVDDDELQGQEFDVQQPCLVCKPG